MSPLFLKTPLDEMESLVAALSVRDSAAVTDMLARGRKRLQHAATDELHRLVGQLITEVALAEDLREKVGRAVDRGTLIMQSRPSDSLLTQFSDPEAFVTRCRAVCKALLTFLTAELNRVLEAAGVTPAADAADLVRDATAELQLALARTAEDGIDRKARIAVSFVRSLTGPHR
jgi:hypothetical protein